MKTLENYAMKILADSGCDCYTYGGEWSKHVLDDLKEGFPDGMEYPYVDVANAILAISRPKPIERAPWRMIWSNEHSCDGIDCKSFGEAKNQALDTLLEWAAEESNGWALDPETYEPLPTEEQKENWDYMFYNCYTYVEKYNPDTDEYEEYWSPSDEDLERHGLKPFYE